MNSKCVALASHVDGLRYKLGSRSGICRIDSGSRDFLVPLMLLLHLHLPVLLFTVLLLLLRFNLLQNVLSARLWLLVGLQVMLLLAVLLLLLLRFNLL
jgi:hypothetical protein